MKKIVEILSRSGAARSQDNWERIATHMAEWISPDSTCNELLLGMVLAQLQDATNKDFSDELRFAIMFVQ